jgi:hypothetical protein
MSGNAGWFGPYLVQRQEINIEVLRSIEGHAHTKWRAVIVDDGSKNGFVELPASVIVNDSGLPPKNEDGAG